MMGVFKRRQALEIEVRNMRMEICDGEGRLLYVNDGYVPVTHTDGSTWLEPDPTYGPFDGGPPPCDPIRQAAKLYGDPANPTPAEEYARRYLMRPRRRRSVARLIVRAFARAFRRLRR